jgi:hypothetical protein
MDKYVIKPLDALTWEASARLVDAWDTALEQSG